MRGTLPARRAAAAVLQRLDPRRGWRNVARARVRSTTASPSAGAPTAAGASACASSSARRAGAAAAAPVANVNVYRPALATFFGPGLYGNPTYCGAVLTPVLHGVAHRTLPCGTQVAILYDRREIIVPVVDRGPFNEGYDWDLTQATADALGFTASGAIGYVRVKPAYRALRRRARRRVRCGDGRGPRLVAAVAVLALGWFAGVRRILNRSKRVARSVIADPEEHTTMDARGAVRSVQGADSRCRAGALDELWTPMHLERLARTYWRFLSRCTLGLIRVRYDEDGRSIVLLARPFVLLRFKAPEYEMDAERGIVRWRIERGVLVSRAGHDGDGYLQIEVRRCAPPRRETPRACTSRSRSRTSIRRWRAASRAGSTPRRSRASTSSSRTASCARSRAWTSRSPSSGATPRRTPCPTRAAGRGSRRPRDRGRERRRVLLRADLARGRRGPARRPRAGRHRLRGGLPVAVLARGHGHPRRPARGDARRPGFNPCFVVRKDDGVVVGEIGYSLRDADGAVGYSIVEPCQGRGYATDALRALVAGCEPTRACGGSPPRRSPSTSRAGG